MTARAEAAEGESAPAARSLAGAERPLLAALFLVVIAFWIEPSGSSLAEPDENRYAEIPREMLATGDFVTPRIDGIPYFEKPPMLYWANAASMRLFGERPWAARLANRLAAMGTLLLLVLTIRRLRGPAAGWLAGVLFLGSPGPFGLSRLNLTDGVLTFFFSATLLAALEILRRSSGKRSTGVLSLLMGLAAAGAFLTKGLIALALPGAILLAWSFLTGRWTRALRLLRGPAVPVFLAASAPWVVLMAQRHPGFLRFFFVHEHFARFTTTEHHREGPWYYFLGVLVAGLLPVVALFAATLPSAPWRRADRWRNPERVFFLTWAAVVLLFFSVSSSKLIPYLLPAFPAVAAFVAMTAVSARASATVWRVQAGLVAALVLTAALLPEVRTWVASYRLLPIILVGAAGLVASALLALRSSRDTGRAVAITFAGWAIFYGALAVAWPRILEAVEIPDFARLARHAGREDGAALLTYRTYLHGLPWELKMLVPAVEYRGELGPGLDTLPATGRSHFLTEDAFWRRWQGGRPLLAVVRDRDLERFDRTRVPPRLLAKGIKHFLVANYAAERSPAPGPLTSPALYTHGTGRRVLVSEVPDSLLRRARERTRGRIVWARELIEDGRPVLELVSGGRFPRAVKLTPEGRFVR